MINWLKKLYRGIGGDEYSEDISPPVKVQTKVVYPNFETMSKLDLDIWARKQLGMRLDKRKSRDSLINIIKENLNKEN